MGAVIAATLAIAVGAAGGLGAIESAVIALGFWPWIGIYCTALAATAYAVLMICHRPKRFAYRSGGVVSALLWAASLAALSFRYVHDVDAGVEWSVYRMCAMWLAVLMPVLAILALMSPKWAEWTFSTR